MVLRTLFGVILGVTTIFLVTGYSYAFEEDIVGAWLFDQEDGRDSSPNGNDGEVNGKAKWVAGKHGRAFECDGSGTYVEVPFEDSMKVLNEGDFTLSAWFKPTEVSERISTVFQQGDANGTGRTWLFVNADDSEVRSFLGGGTTGSGFAVEYEEWYHGAVVVTEGGGIDTIQVYVNGEPEGVPNTTLGIESSEGNYFIGSHKNLPETDFFIGPIDEVVLVKRALTDTEIKELMEKGVMGVLAVTGEVKLTTTWARIKSRD